MVRDVFLHPQFCKQIVCCNLLPLYLTERDNTLFYNEIEKNTNTLCTHAILSIPENHIVQDTHIHYQSGIVSLFLTTYSSTPRQNSDTAKYYLIDLKEGSFKDTGISVPFDNYNILFQEENIYSTHDMYIVSYPVWYSGCSEEDCFEEEGSKFVEFWNSSSIYVLDIEGNKYEIPANTLSSGTDFLFDRSSSPSLIAYTLNSEGEYLVEKTYNLDLLFGR